MAGVVIVLLGSSFLFLFICLMVVRGVQLAFRATIDD